MKKRTKPLLGLLAIVGLAIPMADGCHKHAKANASQHAVVQLASAAIQNTQRFANVAYAESSAHVPPTLNIGP